MKPIRLSLIAVILFNLVVFADASAATKKATTPVSSSSAAQAAPASSDSVWVSKPDGGQSCGIKQGTDLEVGAEELKKAGIAVLESKKGHDKKIHMQVCGTGTGALNLYRISKASQAQAVSLGFNPAE